MSETTTTEGAEKAPEGGEQKQEQTLTQADVDRIVKERIARVDAKYADYPDLKAKAEGAKTLEDRLGSLESELATTKASALRTSVAAKFGISTEKGEDGSPSDADLFLTGSDEATLITQAQRLAGREAAVKKQGNVAPKEGDAKNTGSIEGEERAFVSALFGGSD